MRKIFLVLLLCLWVASPAGAETGKRALVIGVSEYLHADGSLLNNLGGPLNDANLIRTELLPLLGYRPEEVKVLTGPNASKREIQEKIRWLTQGDPESRRFFYFAGHGSQVEDVDGDEREDGLDEVILPYDARYDGSDRLIPETVIKDDELKAWLAPLQGRPLLAVLDSCNSGTGFRSLSRFRNFSVARNRYAINNVRSRAARSGGIGYIQSGSGGADHHEQRESIPENHIYLYAAQSDRTAKEKNFNGRVQGCFTRALVDAARQISVSSPDDNSYLDLYRAVDRIMKEEFNLDQNPDIQPDYLGSDRDAYRNSDSEKLLEPFYAVSTVLPANAADTGTPSLPNPDRFKSRVLVFQEDGVVIQPDDLRSAASFADIDFKKKNGSYSLYVTIRGKRRQVELTNENGYRLNIFSFGDRSDLRKKLLKRIQHQYLKDLLVQIDSKREFPLELETLFKGRRYERNDFYGGQVIAYRLISRVNAYVYVISVDAGGELNILLPFELQPDNRMKNGDALLLPDPRICGDDVFLEVSSEPGEEVVKIIAAEKPIDIRMARVTSTENEDLLTRVGFEAAREAVIGMIRRLRGRDDWYAATKRFMNYTNEDYNQLYSD